MSGALAIAPAAAHYAVRFAACFACLVVMALVAFDSLLAEARRPRKW